MTISSDNVPSSFCAVSTLFKAGMSYLIKLPARAAPSFINLLRGGGEGSQRVSEGAWMSSFGMSVFVLFET